MFPLCIKWASLAFLTASRLLRISSSGGEEAGQYPLTSVSLDNCIESCEIQKKFSRVVSPPSLTWLEAENLKAQYKELGELCHFLIHRCLFPSFKGIKWWPQTTTYLPSVDWEMFVSRVLWFLSQRHSMVKPTHGPVSHTSQPYMTWNLTHSVQPPLRAECYWWEEWTSEQTAVLPGSPVFNSMMAVQTFHSCHRWYFPELGIALWHQENARLPLVDFKLHIHMVDQTELEVLKAMIYGKVRFLYITVSVFFCITGAWPGFFLWYAQLKDWWWSRGENNAFELAICAPLSHFLSKQIILWIMSLR